MFVGQSQGHAMAGGLLATCLLVFDQIVLFLCVVGWYLYMEVYEAS